MTRVGLRWIESGEGRLGLGKGWILVLAVAMYKWLEAGYAFLLPWGWECWRD